MVSFSGAICLRCGSAIIYARSFLFVFVYQNDSIQRNRQDRYRQGGDIGLPKIQQQPYKRRAVTAYNLSPKPQIPLVASRYDTTRHAN